MTGDFSGDIAVDDVSMTQGRCECKYGVLKQAAFFL
jgi:hypothetical protein